MRSLINIALVVLCPLALQAKVLYIVGMETEAQIVRAPDNDVIVAGGSATELRGLLTQTDPKAYTSVIHFGLVGGLSPQLSVGELVLASGITSPTQPTIELGLTKELAAKFSGCNLAFKTVRMTGAENPVATAVERAALRDATGADIADTQIQVDSAWALANGLPFTALGAVSDDWNTNLPPVALLPLSSSGNPEMGEIFLNVLSHPLQIPQLSQLSDNMDAALTQLRSAVNCYRRP